MLKGQECYTREPTNNQVKNSNDQMKKNEKWWWKKKDK
jgi:hypothetical protein